MGTYFKDLAACAPEDRPAFQEAAQLRWLLERAARHHKPEIMAKAALAMESELNIGAIDMSTVSATVQAADVSKVIVLEHSVDPVTGNLVTIEKVGGKAVVG